ncbi:protein stunted-like [Epargyreus clarus]|uniref:protein stunted-like n=1 Tax=Epargyreus clarus TaxID=520877 RepID=UPI003C2EFE23
MSTWRMAGLNYVNYSNIAARTLRKSLKSNLKDEAAKRDQSYIKYFYWVNGNQLLERGHKVASGISLKKPFSPTQATPVSIMSMVKFSRTWRETQGRER